MLKKLKNKIHILQNIYLKNRYFLKTNSYAMDGEDIAIKKYVEHTNNGFYVDVGSHHPVQRSNTCLLYQSGWRGINVDINDFTLDLFNYLRPDDINVQTAISDYNGNIDFYYQKNFSQLNTTDINWAKENFSNNFQTKKIKCQTLNSLLEQTKYKNQKINFFNIDVEGAEMKVLKYLDFNTYDPTVICIEILGYRDLSNTEQEKAIKTNQIYKFLMNKNYKKVWSASSYCSHIFIK
jgi:FkbM family methyltransferase|tara:strand:+ start:411 stop:1118 length:708 start_codon:yes stop_codon:yes gene_type:complete